MMGKDYAQTSWPGNHKPGKKKHNLAKLDHNMLSKLCTQLTHEINGGACPRGDPELSFFSNLPCILHQLPCYKMFYCSSPPRAETFFNSISNPNLRVLENFNMGHFFDVTHSCKISLLIFICKRWVLIGWNQPISVPCGC